MESLVEKIEEKANIIFNIINEKGTKNTINEIEIGFLNQSINPNEIFYIDDKYFSKFKDNIKTSITIKGKKSFTFIINLFYGTNYINIFNSSELGVSYEFIYQYDFTESVVSKKEVFSLFDKKDNVYKINKYDDFGNKYRNRFVIINCPPQYDINNLVTFNKRIKKGKSYKIVFYPTLTTVHEIILNQETNNSKSIYDIYDYINENIKIIDKKYNKYYDENKIKNISQKLKPFEDYFTLNLHIRKDEFLNANNYDIFYKVYYFEFIDLIKNNNGEKRNYFKKGLNRIIKLNEEMEEKKISNYDKILLMYSLRVIILIDSNQRKDKLIFGEYILTDIKELPNNTCYPMAFKFLKDIIDNLKEDSLLFYPILQVNSGFGKNLNSIKKNDLIFETSMLNLKIIKNHLLDIIPRYFFRVSNGGKRDKKGCICHNSGILFLYEYLIFENNQNLNIEKLIMNELYGNNSGIIIGIILLHEIFMHKKFRHIENYPGKNTPSKFIGKNFFLEKFVYSNKINNDEPLFIYNKNRDYLSPKKGESGKIIEYFIGKSYKILYSYYGFGLLFQFIDLFTRKNMDDLEKAIAKSLLINVVFPLKKKIENNNLLRFKHNRKGKKILEFENLSEDDMENVVQYFKNLLPIKQNEELNEEEEELEENNNNYFDEEFEEKMKMYYSA